MNKREREDQHRMLQTLQELGFTYAECEQLRRISMTLRRWYELECGNSNDYGSWAIERDEKTEKPYMVHHHYRHGAGKDTTTRSAIPDREGGARKRLDAILSECNKRRVKPRSSNTALGYYIQTDPRGAALYILRPGDIPEGRDASAYYSRGVCVY